MKFFNINNILYLLFIPLGGKSMAILGGRGVGKTSFKKFLEKQTIPSEPKATDIAELYKPFRAPGLGIRFKGSQDVGGGDDPKPVPAYYNAWEDVVKSSDYVFYLINLQNFLLMENSTNKDIINYKTRVNHDLLEIIEWVKQEKPIIIVGTHADKHPRFSDGDSSEASNEIIKIQDELLKNDTIYGFSNSHHFGKDYVVLIGSFKTNNYAKKLVVDLKKKLELVEKISNQNKKDKNNKEKNNKEEDKNNKEEDKNKS